MWGQDEQVDVSVLVPVYNGASLVAPARTGIAAALEATDRTFEVVFVDDGSDDASWAAILAGAQADERVRGLRLDHNVGQAGATAAGIPRTTGRVVVTTDVDLETDPRDLEELVARIEAGHDVASGRRTVRRHWSRQLPSSAFNAYVRLTGIPLRDIGCGTSAIRREVALAYASVPDIRRELPKAVLATLTDDIVEVPMRSRRPAGSQLTSRHLLALWMAFEGRRARSRRLSTTLVAGAALAAAAGRWAPGAASTRRWCRVSGIGLVATEVGRRAVHLTGARLGHGPRPQVVETVGLGPGGGVRPAS